MRAETESCARQLAAAAAIAVMLGAAASAAADPATVCTRAGEAAPDPHSLGIAVTAGALVGVRWLAVGKVSALVARYGYAPLPQTAVEYGGDLYLTGGRVRLGIEGAGDDRSTKRPRGGQKLPADSFDLALMLGYDVVREGDGSVFVSTGIGGGNLELDIRGKGMGGLVELHDHEGGIMWDYTAVPLQLGAEYFLRLGRVNTEAEWVLRLGVRATWFQQINGGWSAFNDQNGKGPRDLSGPPLDLSGPSAMLSLGFGAAGVSSQ